jgi:hypothetical protein
MSTNDYRAFMDRLLDGSIAPLRLDDATGTYEEDGVIPVGGIYLSAVATDPGLAQAQGGLGYGAWLRYGQGRCLVGVDEGDADWDERGQASDALRHVLRANVHGLSCAGHVARVRRHPVGHVLRSDVHQIAARHAFAHAHGHGHVLRADVHRCHAQRRAAVYRGLHVEDGGLMARKTFKPKEPVHQAKSYAEFMAAVLAGSISAEKLLDDRLPDNVMRMRYDEPGG